MNESLGSNIMRLRKQNDLTQEQLANGLGITYQAVSKWETGVSSPDIDLLPLLADIFEVSIDEPGSLRSRQLRKRNIGRGRAWSSPGRTIRTCCTWCCSPGTS